ncbi:MAG: hypothetical protein ACRDH5_17095, partial [bacterium]
EDVIGGLWMLTFAYVYCAGCPANPDQVIRVDITIQTRSEDSVAFQSVADARSALTTSVSLRNW